MGTGYQLMKADAARIPLPDKSVDICIGSPPYVDARLYLEDGKNLGIARKTEAWVNWMLGVTTEALRVSRGLVLWVCSGKTENWCYQPAPEGLSWEWWKRGGDCHLFRPVYWHRSGIPGSGGEQWFRADVESVLAFKRPGRLPYGDPTANGHAPKFKTNGPPSHRTKNGSRVSGPGQWKRGRRASGNGVGTEESWASNAVQIMPEIANPGNVLYTGAAGGGHLGSKLAHESEAPYPVEVPAFFIASHTPPGGLVLDPFAGSSSTGDAALSLGRRYIGGDLRFSQCILGRKRLRSVTPGLPFDQIAAEAGQC